MLFNLCWTEKCLSEASFTGIYRVPSFAVIYVEKVPSQWWISRSSLDRGFNARPAFTVLRAVFILLGATLFGFFFFNYTVVGEALSFYSCSEELLLHGAAFRKKITAIFCMLIGQFSAFSDFYSPCCAASWLDTHYPCTPEVFQVVKKPWVWLKVLKGARRNAHRIRHATRLWWFWRSQARCKWASRVIFFIWRLMLPADRPPPSVSRGSCCVSSASLPLPTHVQREERGFSLRLTFFVT